MRSKTGCSCGADAQVAVKAYEQEHGVRLLNPHVAPCRMAPESDRREYEERIDSYVQHLETLKGDDLETAILVFGQLAPIPRAPPSHWAPDDRRRAAFMYE